MGDIPLTLQGQTLAVNEFLRVLLYMVRLLVLHNQKDQLDQVTTM